MMIRQSVKELGWQVRMMANRTFESRLYSNWGDAFSLKELRVLQDRLEASTLSVDFKLQELNDDELEELGFVLFQSPSRAIPIYMRRKAIEDGLMTESQDTDTRFGCFWAFIIGTDKK